jgi:hypothetical protein
MCKKEVTLKKKVPELNVDSLLQLPLFAKLALINTTNDEVKKRGFCRYSTIGTVLTPGRLFGKTAESCFRLDGEIILAPRTLWIGFKHEKAEIGDMTSGEEADFQNEANWSQQIKLR